MTRKSDKNPSGGYASKNKGSADKKESPHRMRLPGFITEEKIGLGITDSVIRRSEMAPIYILER